MVKDELKELKKEIEMISTMHNSRFEHLEASLDEKEVQENQLADMNATPSYDLVRAKLRASYIEKTIESWKDSRATQ